MKWLEKPTPSKRSAPASAPHEMVQLKLSGASTSARGKALTLDGALVLDSQNPAGGTIANNLM